MEGYYKARRSNLATYPDSVVLDQYKKVMMDMLHFNFPMLTEEELICAIDHSMSKHFKDAEAILTNNYKRTEISSSLLDLANYITGKEPILTSSGTMFKQHGTGPNPIYSMLDGFINDRKKAKKEMFKYPKGSQLFEKFNLQQLLYKIDANGFYGATGLYSCIYYNIHTATAVTTEGRSCNSAAALFLESFLANNVPMSSINELIQFIHNVLTEERNYSSEAIIDRHASVSETFYQLWHSTGFGYVPTIDEMEMVWEIVEKLPQDDLDRLFYKNNLFNFIDNSFVSTMLLTILQTLQAPFMDPNDPPEEIKELLDEFRSILGEYVYYNKQIIDRVEKMDALMRTVSVVQDTDSVILTFDGWYQYVRQMCYNIPMTIKNISINEEDYVTDGTINAKEAEMVSEYSFLDDDIIEQQRKIDPLYIIPQDGLRYSIINILAYCVGGLVNDYMTRYCRNSHTYNPRPCLINLKNEFLFKRLLVTDAKKHYASKMELQEGHVVPDNQEKSLDIKGMDAFVKSTTNPSIREKLKTILYNDILNVSYVDQMRVLRDLATIEKDIYDSINRGEKAFFKPAKVKAMSAYEAPMRIQGISASYAYNCLHRPGTETIDLSTRNSVDIAKVEITKKTVDKIKDTHPDVYEKALKLLATEEYKTGIGAIALPINEPVPDWMLPFIEFDKILKDNISGFPLESVGIYRGASVNNSTNMIQF